MKTIGNILWVVLGGIELAAAWLLAGLLLAITVIGIPFAVQCFKMARFTFWPFGYTAVESPTAVSGGCIGNILWFIPGLFIAAGYLIQGVLLCITIIGIPFGLQAFKFVPIAISPFGKEIISNRRLDLELATGRYIAQGSFGVPENLR